MGEIKKAIKDYLLVLDYNPDCNITLLNLGICEQELKNYHKALNYYNRSIEINSKLDVVYSNRGFSYLLLNKFTRANIEFDKAMEHNKTNSDSFYGKALIKWLKNDLKGAQECFRKAVRICKKRNQTRLKYFLEILALTYVIAGKYKKGLRLFNKAILEVDNLKKRHCSIVFSNRAYCYFKLKNFLKSERELKLAIEMDSSCFNILRIKGLIYRDKEKFRRSLLYLEKAKQCVLKTVDYGEITKFLNIKLILNPEISEVKEKCK